MIPFRYQSKKDSPFIPGSPDGAFAPTPIVSNVSALLESNGYGDPRCDVYRFWEPAFPVDTTGATVLALVVRCPSGVVTPNSRVSIDNHALVGPRVTVVVSSFGPLGIVNFRLQPSLGVRHGAVAMDAETEELIPSVPGSHGGNFSFRLDKHNFRVVVVE